MPSAPFGCPAEFWQNPRRSVSVNSSPYRLSRRTEPRMSRWYVCLEAEVGLAGPLCMMCLKKWGLTHARYEDYLMLPSPKNASSGTRDTTEIYAKARMPMAFAFPSPDFLLKLSGVLHVPLAGAAPHLRACLGFGFSHLAALSRPSSDACSARELRQASSARIAARETVSAICIRRPRFPDN
jgi:hypothetical protein